MQRTHSHYTVRGDFAPLRNIGALDETTLGERRIRKLEGLPAARRCHRIVRRRVVDRSSDALRATRVHGSG